MKGVGILKKVLKVLFILAGIVVILFLLVMFSAIEYVGIFLVPLLIGSIAIAIPILIIILLVKLIKKIS